MTMDPQSWPGGHPSPLWPRRKVDSGGSQEGGSSSRWSYHREHDVPRTGIILRTSSPLVDPGASTSPPINTRKTSTFGEFLLRSPVQTKSSSFLFIRGPSTPPHHPILASPPTSCHSNGSSSSSDSDAASSDSSIRSTIVDSSTSQSCLHHGEGGRGRRTPPPPPKQQQQQQRRSVHFKLTARVRRTFHIKDLPADIKQEYWYSQEDFKRIRNQNQTIAKHCMHLQKQQQRRRSMLQDEDDESNNEKEEMGGEFPNHGHKTFQECRPFNNRSASEKNGLKVTLQGVVRRPEAIATATTTTCVAAIRPNTMEITRPLDMKKNDLVDVRVAALGQAEIGSCIRGLERMLCRHEAMSRKNSRSRAIFAVVHHDIWWQLEQEKNNARNEDDVVMLTMEPQRTAAAAADTIARVYSSLSHNSVLQALKRGLSDEYEAYNALTPKSPQNDFEDV